MKTYPSIPDTYQNYVGEECVAFYKYDGSNLRFLWTKKHGWSRYGTRTRLFDESDKIFGSAIGIFKEKFAERLTWIIRHDKLFNGANEVIAFCEFFGPSSFAGMHASIEPKELVLFDVNIGARGIIDPFKFKTMFNSVNSAKPVFEGILTEEVIRGFRQGKGGLFEGVICKGGSKHNLWMAKIKTRDYIGRLKHQVYSMQKESLEHGMACLLPCEFNHLSELPKFRHVHLDGCIECQERKHKHAHDSTYA